MSCSVVLSSHRIVARVDRVKSVAVTGVDELVVDEELVGESERHVVDLAFHRFVRELLLSGDATPNHDDFLDELIERRCHVNVLVLKRHATLDLDLLHQPTRKTTTLNNILVVELS